MGKKMSQKLFLRTRNPFQEPVKMKKNINIVC